MLKKQLLTLTILLAVLLNGCSSKNTKTMQVYNVNKKILPNKILKIEVDDISVEAISAGIFWVILSPYAIAAKSYSKISRNMLAKKTILTKLKEAKNIEVVEEGGDYILDFIFASSNNSDYNFVATITVRDSQTDNIVFTKDYDAFPSSSVDDSDILLESAFQNLITQFVHDKQALIAMNGLEDDGSAYKQALREENNFNNRLSIIETASESIQTVEREASLSEIISDYSFKEATEKNSDSFALVIGINKYKQNPNVKYANYSALAFTELAKKTFGIPKENIITLIDEEATSGQIKAKIEFIKEIADKNGKIYLYFAGHGVPAKDGNTYLLPSDMSADSIHLEQNLKLKNIYAKLSESNAEHVFIFIDSCFSGQDDKGELLYKGVAPVLRTDMSIEPEEKITIFTAGKSKDFANDYEAKQQRMFTYFLIKELSQGTNNLEEIYSSVKKDVKRKSLIKGLGYKQIPQLYGNSSKGIF